MSLKTVSKRKRVMVMCVKCQEFFRYMYPGNGPYRSVCNTCCKAEGRKRVKR